MENIQTEYRMKNNWKSDVTLRDLWNNVQWNNSHIIEGVPEGEERKKGQKKIV